MTSAKKRNALLALKKQINSLLTFAKGEDFGPHNLMVRIPQLMNTIERSNHILKMPGKEKKEMLLHALQTWTLSQKNKELEHFVKNIVPPLIDTLVLVDTKQLSIKVKKCVGKCW